MERMIERRDEAHKRAQEFAKWNKKQIAIEKRDYCMTCAYFMISGSDPTMSSGTCDYIGKTNHIRPSLPGKECVEKEVYKPRKKKRRAKSYRVKI